ncbi:MAG: chitobiase/beta-hexosaminidase C-terminal domain-containing protein [Bacteroidales bacterium]|nr:chitobiase/beta-hexosaminidase C-terminal domain-containing protein [Candidatus Colimorpha onthohippi]
MSYTNNYEDRVSEIESKEFSAKGWNKIQLPDVRWLSKGNVLQLSKIPQNAQIGFAGNHTAVYYTEFETDKDWKDYDVFLQLQPLSACYVWVNREYVGYTTDSRSISEFDISKHLKPGKLNSITLQLVSYSTASLLDMTKDSRHLGFCSEVALLLKNAVNIQDYALRADYHGGDGVFAIDITADNKYRKGRYYVEVELWNPQGRQCEKMGRWFFFDKRSEIQVNIERDVKNVQPWSAEHPNLYTAVIRILDEDMNTVETVGTKFGFRSVAVDGTHLLVNGKAVKLRGVIYADYTFDADGVVDYDLVESDLKRMKQLNINAIRTAVYSPADQRFYELCDKYGFYVICDANLNPFSTQTKVIATDNGYSDFFASRVQNMYEQFKNHSSIIAWSLGASRDNGSCMTTAYKQLKMKDRGRPVIFSGAGYGDNTDVIALENATYDQVRQYLGRPQSRPLLLFSYGSSQGNGMGGLEPLWDLVYANSSVQGGFLNCWNSYMCNQMSNSASCVVQGLYGDTSARHPLLRTLSALYRPFDIQMLSLSSDAGEFSITNRSQFGVDYAIDYTIFTNLKPSIISGEVPQLPGAGDTKRFKLKLPNMSLYAGEELFIGFSVRQRYSDNAVSKEQSLYVTQFQIPATQMARHPLPDYAMQPIKVKEVRSDDTTHSLRILRVEGPFGCAEFNMQQGELSQYVYHNTPLLSAPLRLNFWRLPTDSELNTSGNGSLKSWKMLRDDLMKRKITDITYSRPDSGSLAVDMMLQYSNQSGVVLMDVRQTFLLLYTGDVILSSHIMMSDALKSMPRVGLQTRLSGVLSTAEWFGNDIESYSDRFAGARIATYSRPVGDLYYRYPRPQEAGSRMGTRWVALKNDNVGLFAEMIDTTMSFSVYPYTDLSLAAAKSYESLKEEKSMTLNLDARMAGIGSGTGSESRVAEGAVTNHKIHFTAHLSGFDPNETSPLDFQRVAYPEVSSNVLSMPDIEKDRERFDGPMMISIHSADTAVRIHYTIDGSDPTEQSLLYTAPFEIVTTTTVKARAYADDAAPSFTSSLRCDYDYVESVLFDHKPNTPYNHNASKALFDGETGDANDLSQGWLGFSGGDCSATFQLSKNVAVEEVVLRFAHNPEAWIFAPAQVQIFLSSDGTTFADSVTAPIQYNPSDQAEADPIVREVVTKIDRPSVKAIKVVVSGIGKIPNWHRARGLKPWLMMDEIYVKERR